MGDLLHHTIDMRWGNGGDAVPQDCCIPPLQQHTQASPEVVDSFALILPRMTSHLMFGKNIHPLSTIS